MSHEAFKILLVCQKKHLVIHSSSLNNVPSIKKKESEIDLIKEEDLSLQLKIMESQNYPFCQLLKTLLNNNLYERAIYQATKKYKIKHYRIEKLKPSGIKNLMKKNCKKQKKLNLEDNNYAWAQGQLKIFVWLLVGYVYVNKIDISDMNQRDFQLFSQIFQGYPPEFLLYQAKFLIKRPQKVNWNDHQAKLLSEIIKVKFQQRNWNTVAYELYLISNKNVFRSPKQCRERWLNHEDPVKDHSQWKTQQDIQLLKFVKTQGKKWSSISKLMNSTRTEHMVKNRFTSLIKKSSKANKFLSEKDLIKQLIKQKMSEKPEEEKSLIEQENLVQAESKMPPQIRIELKEIENPYDQGDPKKKNQRYSEYFTPINLIPELGKADGVETDEAIHEKILNFFEQDDRISTDKYSDYFFTVPQPSKQI